MTNYRKNILDTIQNIPKGTTIVAIKNDYVSFFKPDEKEGHFLTFGQTMWVKTWFKNGEISLNNYDVLIRI